MERIDIPSVPWPLHGVAASQRIEREALARNAPHVLMRRAGAAVARLALAVAPHARRVWILAGPGNNGGDGLEAAIHLRALGLDVRVTLPVAISRRPADAEDALARASAAGLAIETSLPDAVVDADLVIDALLGLGANRAPEGALGDAVVRINGTASTVLAVDLPSGLDADTGQPRGSHVVRASHTLCLLTVKPGLFTGSGRDLAGTVWLDGLGQAQPGPPDAWLGAAAPRPRRLHAQHKGSFGDTLVIGGAAGMTGAAVLAARAALVLGSGRVYAALLDPDPPTLDPSSPELMLRALDWGLLPQTLQACTVVGGCGGAAAVAPVLPALLHHARRLVLDADGLNAVAADRGLQAALHGRAARGRPTVITPHPLEAARLLECKATQVQSDRLHAARELAARLNCTVVLKGSGTVIAAADRTPVINPTGNARLASAGTGDVLAGAIGGLWSQSPSAAPAEVAADAAWRHGAAAGAAAKAGGALTASRLIEAMSLDAG